MFEKWIEIFKTGAHTDSAGNTKTWTEADLDKIVGNYKPGEHEAPVVIGHPKDNVPAYGWIEGLKRQGNVLLAKFKQVAPEFAEMVKKGMFKKRSIALYPDLRLRHVGFLGAQPPAVKGLKDVEFQDTETKLEYVFELAHSEPTKPTGNQYTFLNPEGDKNMDIKFADLLQKFNEVQSTVSQYQQQIQERDTQIADLTARIDTMKQEARHKEFGAFSERLIKQGKLLPKNKEAVIAMMEKLDGGELQFGEKKVDSVKTFMEFLETQPKIMHFEELMRKEDNDKDGKNVSPFRQVRDEIAKNMEG